MQSKTRTSRKQRKHGPVAVLAAVLVLAAIVAGPPVARALSVAVRPALIVLGSVALTRLAIGVIRFAMASPAARCNYPLMVLASARWRWTCRALGLVLVDQHRGRKSGKGGTEGKPRVRHPRARFRADDHGIVVRAKTVPTVGRAEVEKQADHIANEWRVQRVSVTAPRPGRLLIRGMIRDPLTDPLGSEAVPALQDLTEVYIGRDEFGDHRRLRVAGNTAVCVSGLPGSGKSCVINSLLYQWAPMPFAQFSTADGKNSAESSEFAPWADRALRTCGDDRDEVADMLAGEVEEMKRRQRSVYKLLGVRNGWHRGPCEEMSFRAVILDEAQRWLSLEAVRGDKKLEAVVRRCQEYSQEIVRLGRAVMMFLIVGTQRPMADTINPHVRDNAALNLAFALKTMDGAIAALGSEVRAYESFSPTRLQGPEYVGAAVTTLRTGMDPFTKVKLPLFTEAEIAARARETARLRADPAASNALDAPVLSVVAS